MEEPKEPKEPKEPVEPKEPEQGGVDIKTTPEYIAMKEMLANQTTELEKLQKQVKDLQVEKEKIGFIIWNRGPQTGAARQCMARILSLFT